MIGAFSHRCNSRHRLAKSFVGVPRQRDHVVDTLASDRPDQPFGEAILPRRAWGDRLVADAHGSQSVRDGSTVDPIPIADQVAGGLIPRECLRDLACNPVRGRMRCDVDPDKISAGQPDDDEGIEQVEANGRSNE